MASVLFRKSFSLGYTPSSKKTSFSAPKVQSFQPKSFSSSRYLKAQPAARVETKGTSLQDTTVKPDQEDWNPDVLKGGFGTKEKPVQVSSLYDFRVVGCVGGKDSEHDLMWHMVRKGKPTVCLTCGQFFSLQSSAAHSHTHH